VNLILFELADSTMPLARRDPRAVHMLEVLRLREGDTFHAGLVNGPRGQGVLAAIGAEVLTLAFTWGSEPPPLDAITLIVGLPRPQTARKILEEATALGLAAMHFVRTDKGERSYSQSTLWSTGEWREHLVRGAEQAFCTRLPELTHGRRLAEVLATFPEPTTRIALDNYEAPQSLSRRLIAPDHPVALALGSERGWSDAERHELRTAGFAFAHLGSRVLRAETACVAALALVKAKLGSL
jgi:RsmE family RNA methyltransferase